VRDISGPSASHALPITHTFSSSFTSATCLALPALLTTPEIPPVLRALRRALAPHGALHLTVIDPAPAAASTGPLLRRWLLEHLLLRLEQTGRAAPPSRAVPAWLSVAGLRGPGSTIATRRVPAVPAGGDPGSSSTTTMTTTTTAALRCAVLRMLWREVWGRCVCAHRWWWDEPDIVRECEERGTYWEYSHIVAVKGGD
jgi:hypothetical protein